MEKPSKMGWDIMVVVVQDHKEESRKALMNAINEGFEPFSVVQTLIMPKSMIQEPNPKPEFAERVWLKRQAEIPNK